MPTRKDNHQRPLFSSFVLHRNYTGEKRQSSASTVLFICLTCEQYRREKTIISFHCSVYLSYIRTTRSEKTIISVHCFLYLSYIRTMSTRKDNRQRLLFSLFDLHKNNTGEKRQSPHPLFSFCSVFYQIGSTDSIVKDKNFLSHLPKSQCTPEVRNLCFDHH